YKGLYKEINPGNKILIDDGLLELEVIEIKNKDIICEVKNTTKLGSTKTVSLPDVKVRIKSPTKKDWDDIEWGIKNDVDFIALSFVRNSKEVESVRKILDKSGSKIKLISKIENKEGLDNFDDILSSSDGIMIARGDLAVEIPAEEVPLLQKELIFKCNIAGKPAITATQMLESMAYNPRPTRAEINDVANAVLDGTDAVMLSGETAKGNYPMLSVKHMATACKYIEKNSPDLIKRVHKADLPKFRINEFITNSVYHASKHLPEIKSILAPTKTGYTARKICRFKPNVPIIAFVEDVRLARQLHLSWGIYPILFDHPKTTSELIAKSIELSLENNLIKEEDTIIVTAGVPIRQSGTTNMLEIINAGDYLKFRHQSQ
ncbi:pyruvate kinase, partial [archaeon D22]